MVERLYLGIFDYVVIALTLLISATIGILFRYCGGKQNTMAKYSLAGRNMSKFPVIFSITVTMTSANTMLGVPSESYRYGAQYVMKTFGLALGIILSSYIFVPVYFQCGVSTIYEYLEMRFGKLTRYTISLAYTIQMVFYMSTTLYAVVLALSAVTVLSFEMSVIAVGLCCTFYCSIGGLKAVMWTDVFQAFLMCFCVITVCVVGICDIGGISNAFKIANAGKRLQIFNFSMDLTKRYTFWNCLIRGIWIGLAYYGTSQTEVQRMLSMRTTERAKSVLLVSILPVTCFHLLCDFIGLLFYGLFHSCDPVLNRNETGLTKYDQILPYYIVTRIGAIPGLTGLCIAGLFSGSLSTISSVLNSLATVTVVDFLKPFFPLYFNESKSVITAKILTALYGIICICCALSLSKVNSLIQVTTTLISLMEGPMVAIFLIAVLTRKASDKCILFGFLVSFPIICWIGFGSLIKKYVEPDLPLHTYGCSSNLTSLNMTISSIFQGNYSVSTTNTPKDYSDMLIIYKISFNWFPIIGTLLTLTIVFLAIIVTGWKRNVISSDSKCLSPVTRLWTRKNSNTKNDITSTYQLQGLHGFIVNNETSCADENKSEICKRTYPCDNVTK